MNKLILNLVTMVMVRVIIVPMVIIARTMVMVRVIIVPMVIIAMVEGMTSMSAMSKRVVSSNYRT